MFHRHARHAEATRRAVAGWGLEVLCADPREHSNSLTAVVVPDGFDADRVREIILDGFDMSLGTGLGKMRGKVFRIGHLGHFNDLMLCGTLAGSRWGCTAPASRTAPAASRRRWRISARCCPISRRRRNIGRRSSKPRTVKCLKSTAKKPPACCARRAAGHRYTNCRRVVGRNRTPTPMRSGSGDPPARRDGRRLEGRCGIGEQRRVLRPDLDEDDRRARHPTTPGNSGSSASRPRSPFGSAAIFRRVPQPYNRAEVTAGASLHPAIEVVDSRYRISARSTGCRSWPTISRMAGWSTGRRCRTGESWTSATPGSAVTEDGEPFADSTAGAARDPVAALVDFANLMNNRGGAKAGTFVTTGSWTGMVFTKRGARIVADFGPLGRVEVAFPVDE